MGTILQAVQAFGTVAMVLGMGLLVVRFLIGGTR